MCYLSQTAKFFENQLLAGFVSYTQQITSRPKVGSLRFKFREQSWNGPPRKK